MESLLPLTEWSWTTAEISKLRETWAEDNHPELLKQIEDDPDDDDALDGSTNSGGMSKQTSSIGTFLLSPKPLLNRSAPQLRPSR